MSSSAIPIRLQPRTEACHAVTAWHSEAALLVCSFAYSADPARAPATVAERIESALGVSTTPPRALLGDVDLTWRDETRLHAIELRTGRSQWQTSSLPIPSASAEQQSMTLDLAYDDDRIASVKLDVQVLWDAPQASIALRFGCAGPENGSWFALADSAFVCVDDDQTLIEFRFAAVQLCSSRLA